MIQKIVKRDGREVNFDIEKIANAIYKAAEAIGGKDYQTSLDLAKMVVNYIEEELELERPTVEQIQDAVERVLVEEGHTRTAKEFILYRSQRTRVREMNTRLMKVYEDLTFKPAKENDVKRENANIDGDTAMGTMLKYGSEGAKQFYDMFILDPKHSEAHRNGDIHIHDLDFLTLTTTCCQIDLNKLFDGGFSTGHGFLREPNDIASYSALACIAIQSNQNDQHGGQSVPNFDYSMAPGVAKTYKRRYTQNLGRAFELMMNNQNGMEDAKALIEKIEKDQNIIPSLSNTKTYNEILASELSCICESEKDIKKILDFCSDSAYKETDRATYQAMEALVHNLNTMHSRAGHKYPSVL